MKSFLTIAPHSKEPKRPDPSRVREHLSNERTYLAWMRTAISMMGFSVVLVRLRVLHPPLALRSGNTWKLGLLFSLVSLLTVFLSTQHYFAVRHDIDEDTYEPADRWVLLSSLAVIFLGAGALYFAFAAPLDPGGRG